jgi:hypothetical protein
MSGNVVAISGTFGVKQSDNDVGVHRHDRHNNRRHCGVGGYAAR